MAVTYNPQIGISAAPGIAGYLRLALYEATAPTIEVANSGQLAPPHSVSRQLQFTGLRPVIHLAYLYITNGVDPTGTIIANFSLDPRYPGVEVKTPLFLYAGTTPGFDVGTNVFTDPTGELEGWDFEVDIRGFGRLDPDTELDRTAPGYEVLIPDYQLQEGELHIVNFTPIIVTYAGEPDTPTLFSGVEVITSDQTLTAGQVGKMLVLQSATSTLNLELPDIDDVASGKHFWFSSQGGSHKNVTITVNGTDSEVIDYGLGDLQEIILGQGEQLILYKWIDPGDPLNKRWKAAMASEGINMVGEIVTGNQYVSADLINLIQAAGQLVDRDIYPRLWAHVQSLDSSLLVADGVWDTDANRGRYSTGDGSTTFRLPRLYDTGFLKGVDGVVRKAGSREEQETETMYTKFDPDASQDFKVNKITTPTWAANWQMSDSSGDTSGATTGNRTTGLAHGILGDGTETRPANTGAYLLIRI